MRLISRTYRERYRRVFESACRDSPEGFYDDSGLPSYTHRNSLMSWLFWKRVDTALALAGQIRGQSVLDFGCGGGVTFRYLHDRGCEIVGCDRASVRLAGELCRAFGIAAELHEDLTDIGDRTFDVVFALDVFEHVENLGPVVDTILSHCHAGSRIIVSGPTESLPYRLGRWLAGFSRHGHVRDIYAVEKLLESKGLTCSKVKRLYLPFPLFRISDWKPRERMAQ
ncbi:MAG: class I SAM-dependent methyltransferase [Planctomycetota bacterium]